MIGHFPGDACAFRPPLGSHGSPDGKESWLIGEAYSTGRWPQHVIEFRSFLLEPSSWGGSFRREDLVKDAGVPTVRKSQTRLVSGDSVRDKHDLIKFPGQTPRVIEFTSWSNACLNNRHCPFRRCLGPHKVGNRTCPRPNEPC